MEKRITNPWKWQDSRNYVQAVEVKKAEGTLYISGQTAIDADGKSGAGDMKCQFIQTLQNLEQVVHSNGQTNRVEAYTKHAAIYGSCTGSYAVCSQIAKCRSGLRLGSWHTKQFYANHPLSISVKFLI